MEREVVFGRMRTCTMNKHLQWQCNGSAMACTAQWQKQCICSMKTCHPRSNQKGLVLFGCSILEHAGILGYITLHWLLPEKLVSTSAAVKEKTFAIAHLCSLCKDVAALYKRTTVQNLIVYWCNGACYPEPVMS